MRLLHASLAGALSVLLVLPGPTPVQAQDGFLFRGPVAQFTLRSGPMVPRASSEIFDFFTSELTLSRGDFLAPAVSGELAFVLHPRADVSVGLSWAESSAHSETRDFVEEGPTESPDDDLPIRQRTQMRTVPLTASVRFFPWARGESVSELAWVPRRITPYATAGAGLIWYTLRQSGDFVDRTSLEIFSAEFASSERALSVHGGAGVDVWLNAQFGLNVEARYRHATASLGNDFSTWEEIDLSGLQAGLGVTVRW